ncbi:MAG: hypothetical protein ABMA26_08510 [Limisphaerales bacterium]
MNTKSFRREILIGIGGFVAGVLALALALALWPQRPLGLQVTHTAPGVNYVMVPKPPEVSFQAEFGLWAPGSAGADTVERGKSAYGKLNLFDLPRQQPWVAPYEFLIHPDQRR